MRWLILLLLFLSSAVNAQIHFPDSSGQWVYYCAHMSWVLGEENIYYFGGNDRYFLNGDTLIEGTIYTKIYFEDYAHTEYPDTAASVCIGGLRESAGRVYYRGVQGWSNLNVFEQLDSVPDDIMLYDFNALEGDTILHLVNYRTGSVDSLFSIINYAQAISSPFGQVRSYWADRYVSRDDFPGYEIIQYSSYQALEAYGAEPLGLFGPLEWVFEGGCELFCFTSPDYTYDWDSFASCDNVNVPERENNSQHCLTYSQNTIVSSCNSPNSVISIYDMTGKLVQTENYSAGGFDCSFLTNGIYLAAVQSETKRSVLKFAVTR
jgi:hypothetical protein